MKEFSIGEKVAEVYYRNQCPFMFPIQQDCDNCKYDVCHKRKKLLAELIDQAAEEQRLVGKF